ncbi:hypothetical protein AAVH_17296 [Aphelenchoides avenae]|nr:hypothetical protein AAVH_17296 [Aphelenchus avenae]
MFRRFVFLALVSTVLLAVAMADLEDQKEQVKKALGDLKQGSEQTKKEVQAKLDELSGGFEAQSEQAQEKGKKILEKIMQTLDHAKGGHGDGANQILDKIKSMF